MDQNADRFLSELSAGPLSVDMEKRVEKEGTGLTSVTWSWSWRYETV